MPVVTLIAAAHPRIDDLLRDLADAIAGALGLGAGDVIATHVAAGGSVSSGSAASTACRWPVVSIHGSDRGRERMDSARTAARAVVERWCASEGMDCEGVWSQWLLPQPA